MPNGHQGQWSKALRATFKRWATWFGREEIDSEHTYVKDYKERDSHGQNRGSRQLLFRKALPLAQYIVAVMMTWKKEINKNAKKYVRRLWKNQARV